MKQWRKVKLLLTTNYWAYWAHKHQHAIGTFNTCLRGATHQSLTDTGGATTLKVPAFHIPLPDLPN
jgi:hypothetical protein